MNSLFYIVLVLTISCLVYALLCNVFPCLITGGVTWIM